jgi:hypothetical protein
MTVDKGLTLLNASATKIRTVLRVSVLGAFLSALQKNNNFLTTC